MEQHIASWDPLEGCRAILSLLRANFAAKSKVEQIFHSYIAETLSSNSSSSKLRSDWDHSVGIHVRTLLQDAPDWARPFIMEGMVKLAQKSPLHGLASLSHMMLGVS